MLFLIHAGVHAQVLIGPSPANQAALIGTTHTLTCRRGPDGATGFVTWEENLNPTVALFIDDQKQSPDLKYINFNLDPSNLHDLVISSIAVEDEGTYTCKNTADESSRQNVTLTVEGKIKYIIYRIITNRHKTLNFDKQPICQI